MAKRPNSNAGNSPPKRMTAKPKAGVVGEGLLSLGCLLSLRQDDPALKEAVEALGGKIRVRPSRFLSIKKAGVEFRFEKESGGKRRRAIARAVRADWGGRLRRGRS